MRTPLARRVGGRWRIWLADLLTASRALVALALVSGASPSGSVLLVTWAWTSDALDGPLARSSGAEGHLSAFDRPVDAAVAVSLLWYLTRAGALPLVATRSTAAGLLGLWIVTRLLAVQMLLVAIAYGAFLWWAFDTPTQGRWLLAAVAASIAMLERRRLVTELVPTFLGGWRALGRSWRLPRP